MPRRKGETAVQVSAASFFASNQAIAGFDNPGKSLFTSIRELVENSLDACEAIAQLPSIELRVEELSDTDFERIRGIGPARSSTASAGAAAPPKSRKRQRVDEAPRFFRITCRDNGCGMPHDQVPHMLGRVLSGSKYVVRQTRGKFGLGAKMALIWSKKSTGLPITVTTAHSVTAAARARGPPARVTRCVLDIDVQRNEPRVVSHLLEANDEGFAGTELSVVIGGAWTAYRRNVLRYMQQLAIITPYAELSFAYTSPSDAASDRSFRYKWERRAVVMPPPAAEVKHHPASVNNLVVRRLADLALGVADVTSGRVGKADADADSDGDFHDDDDDDDDDGDFDGGAAASASAPRPAGKSVSLQSFLLRWFACVRPAAAAAIIASLPASLRLDKASRLASMGPKHIHALTTALRAARLPPPSGSCLSPVGEYNLRLGILKELRPDMLATFAATPSAFDGHPFVVEAGVALGGGAPEGLTVHRFANRIPLLFEGGADVATLTAQRLAWKSYGIDPRTDRVAVFVSVVSTKIPFKGTGKEYIGDDAEPIRTSVKSSLQRCCQQLKVKLRRRQSAKDRASRAKSLTKYIPTVAQALCAVLRVAAGDEAPPSSSSSSSSSSAAGGADAESSTRQVPAATGPATTSVRSAKRARMLSSLATGELSEEALAAKLEAAVMRSDALDAAAEAAERQAATVAALSTGSKKPDAGGGEERLLFAAPLGADARRALVRCVLESGAVFAALPGALAPDV